MTIGLMTKRPSQTFNDFNKTAIETTRQVLSVEVLFSLLNGTRQYLIYELET